MSLLYPLLPIVSGAGILWWALRELRLMVFLRGHGTRVDGEVVGYAETSRSARMIVRFRTEQGREVHTTHSNTDWTAARKGQQVVVAYDPDDPERARIVKGPWLSQWTWWLLALTGLALLLIGCALGFFAWT